MKIILKKTLWFTGITLCLVVIPLFAVVGCEKPENPSKNGDIDSTLLVGEWDCIKFAYIADDKSVSDLAILSTGRLVIHNIEDWWTLFCGRNEYRCDYSISGDSISFITVAAMSYAMPTPEETEIVSALENAYSFSIKDDELMFHFTGLENKNLLILKKR